MIYDMLNTIDSYSDSPAWQKAAAFLKTLSPDCDEGEYEIEGETVFARVMSAKTRRFDEAFPEAHEVYVDIQMVLKGEEIAVWYPLTALQVEIPYDPDKDLVFFKQNETEAESVLLKPGRFAVFFPQDGHMPLMAIDEKPADVKKVVVKIAADHL